MKPYVSERGLHCNFNAVANIGSGIQLPHFEWRLGAFRLQHIVEVVISLISERFRIILWNTVHCSSTP
jgi:hypothetical protein